MHRHTSTIALAVAVLALAVFPACKKDGGASGAAGDAMGYLPKDSSMVVTANLDKARSSGLFKKYEDKLASQVPEEMAEFKAACKMDPMEDLNTAVIGVGANPDDEKQIVFVVKGNFDRAKVENCLGEMAKKDGKELVKTEDGKVVHYANGEGGDSFYAYWPDDSTLVGSPSGERLKAVIDGASVKDNKEVMAMVGKVDSGATVWVAGNVPAEAAGAMGPMGTPPKGVYVSLTATSGLDFTAGLAYEKKEDADKLKAMSAMLPAMADQAGPLADVVKGIKIEQDGNDVIVKASLTAEQLDSVSQMAGGF